jgi:F-type H+-transporting ATPase subunit delta
MKQVSICIKYANLLLFVASKNKQEELYLNQLRDVTDLFQAEGLLHKTLLSPLVTNREKSNVLKKLLGERIDHGLLLFLTIVLKRHRMPLLPEILTQFTQKVKQQMGITPVEIVSVEKMDSASKQILEEKLEKALNTKLEFIEKQDPRLLGGITLLFPNQQMLDLSLKTRLNHLQTYLKGSRHAIQP